MKRIINIIILCLLPSAITCMETDQWQLCSTIELEDAPSAYFADLGKTLITCAGNTISSIDMESQKKIPLLPLPYHKVCTACMDPSDKILAVSADKKIHLFDRATLKEITSFDSYQAIAPKHFNREGKRLAINDSPYARIFDISSQKEVTSRKTFYENEVIIDICFHPQEEQFAVVEIELFDGGVADSDIHVFDINKNQLIVSMGGDDHNFYRSICFSKTGKKLAIARSDQICIVNAKSKDWGQHHPYLPANNTSSLYVNNDETIVAALSDEELSMGLA